jgi:hypothetical protein
LISATMSSSTAKATTDAKMEVDAPKKKQIPALGVLEEDDEFEEFPAQGNACKSVPLRHP